MAGPAACGPRQTPVRNGAVFPFEDAFLTDVCATADGERRRVGRHHQGEGFGASDAGGRGLLSDESVSDESVSDEPVSVDMMSQTLRGWVLTRTREEALSTLLAYDIVAGPVYTTRDIVADPHGRAATWSRCRATTASTSRCPRSCRR